MCDDSDEDGNEDESDLANAFQRKSARPEYDSLTNALRKPGPERLLGIPVKEPEHDEGRWKIEDEDAQD